MDNQNNNFKCKDLYLAAYFYSQGIELQGVDREGRTCWFVFNQKGLCEELTTNYWANKAQGLIKPYAEAIRTLKDLIYAQK